MCSERTTILLVEDDGDTSFALSILLGVEGYKVVRASSVKEAYDDAMAEHPDLVVTDMEMPLQSGLDLIKLFKQNSTLARIPIIVVSAMEKARLQIARAVGAVAVYQKPLEYERLISAIRNLLPRTGVAVAGK